MIKKILKNYNTYQETILSKEWIEKQFWILHRVSL